MFTIKRSTFSSTLSNPNPDSNPNIKPLLSVKFKTKS